MTDEYDTKKTGGVFDAYYKNSDNVYDAFTEAARVARGAHEGATGNVEGYGTAAHCGNGSGKKR